jgi:hypothetical protein
VQLLRSGAAALSRKYHNETSLQYVRVLWFCRGALFRIFKWSIHAKNQQLEHESADCRRFWVRIEWRLAENAVAYKKIW